MRRTSRGGGRWVVGDEKLFSKRELCLLAQRSSALQRSFMSGLRWQFDLQFVFSLYVAASVATYEVDQIRVAQQINDYIDMIDDWMFNSWKSRVRVLSDHQQSVSDLRGSTVEAMVCTGRGLREKHSSDPVASQRTFSGAHGCFLLFSAAAACAASFAT